MNKRRLHICLLLLLLISCSASINAQLSNAVQKGESVTLFSDRALYTASEQILFSAFIEKSDVIANSEPSTVLYCEIITPDGTELSSDKYLIKDSFVSGHLLIPGDITTGIYYLRAYTKEMRNNGPAGYSYTRIKVVNANRTEVQSAPGDDVISVDLASGKIADKANDLFTISSEKPEYSPLETVNISVKSKATVQDQWKELTVSVIPESSFLESDVTLSENGFSEKSIIYYPETRGLSLTGKLIDNKTGNAMPDTRVNLSVIGQGRDFMAMKTDTAGRFFFALPDYAGFRDLFLCAEKTGNSDPKLLVDNDYCRIPIHIPTGTFTLTPEERSVALNMAVNLQLEEFFRKDSVSVGDKSTAGDDAFYGSPDEILSIDNYIQLPTLEEYFNGLPTLVKVRKREGEKYFKILGPQTELTEYDPLLMIDLVAIDDPAKILAIPPANVARIEIVNEMYVKGDQTYGGIINIISKHGDFAGIDLPSSGIFINYGFYSTTNLQRAVNPVNNHTPDTRNTLFWEPQLILNQSSTAELSFTTPNTPGRFLLVLSGITAKGEIYRQTTTFEVVK